MARILAIRSRTGSRLAQADAVAGPMPKGQTSTRSASSEILADVEAVAQHRAWRASGGRDLAWAWSGSGGRRPHLAAVRRQFDLAGPHALAALNVRAGREPLAMPGRLGALRPRDQWAIIAVRVSA